jgi:hypothetical protein
MRYFKIPPVFLLALLFNCSLSTITFSQTPQQANVVDTGAMPQVFAPGIISTPYTEWSTSFTPDGQTVYSSQGAIYWTIIYSKKQADQWQKPQVAAFSGKFRDTDPFVTPDGKRIFFISSRPFLSGAPPDKPQRVMHIWYADHVGTNGWGTPHHLDSLINLNGVDNYAPSVSLKGTVYYCSRRKGLNGMQSFYTEWQGDHYTAPKQVIIKGADEIQDPFIAPDERYLIFLNGNDIYISYHQNNEWLPAQKLPACVNNGDGNSSPYVSPDGKTLYYSSPRVAGFYKRDIKNHTLNYDELLKENGGLFNSQPNILMIPIHLPKS